MKTLDKQRELIIEIADLQGDERQSKKEILNSMIQSELDIRREEKRLDELKTDLAIASNT